jgi:hypothetical protein
MYDVGKTLNQPSVEIAESNEGSEITEPLGYWLSLHGTDFA